MPAHHYTHFTSPLFLLSALSAATTALVYHSPVLYARAENLQFFNSSLGGIPALPILLSDDEKRPFQVKDSTFPSFEEASKRSCDLQYNDCNNAANAQGNKAGTLRISDCDAQKASCLAFQKVAPKQNFDAVAIAEATVAQPVATAPVVLSVPPVEAAPPAETINTAPALAAAPTGALVQATFPEFIGTDPNDPEFDLFCDP